MCQVSLGGRRHSCSLPEVMLGWFHITKVGTVWGGGRRPAPSRRAGDRTGHHGPSHSKGNMARALQLGSFTEYLNPSEQPASQPQVILPTVTRLLPRVS